MIIRLLVAALLLPGPGPGPAPGFTFTDPAITESSGLVVDDSTGAGLVVTTNDSGDTGRVFTVDPRTGDTVGVTTWSQDPVDVEALAPAGPGEVWAADIGDNDAVRSSVSVALVPVGRGEVDVEPRTRVELRYPDGPRDAETLLVDPAGRLLVVTKSLLGGEFLRTEGPIDPDEGARSARMLAVGVALPIATDGAFLPDGRHLVVRSYGSAVVYAYPSLEAVGRFELPPQQQGEGIAVDASGRIFLSSEGAGSEVLRVRLPRDVRRAMAPAERQQSDRPGPDRPGAPRATEDEGPPPWGGALLGLAVLGGLAVLAGAWVRRTTRRPRG